MAEPRLFQAKIGTMPGGHIRVRGYPMEPPEAGTFIRYKEARMIESRSGRHYGVHKYDPWSTGLVNRWDAQQERLFISR